MSDHTSDPEDDPPILAPHTKAPYVPIQASTPYIRLDPPNLDAFLTEEEKTRLKSKERCDCDIKQTKEIIKSFFYSIFIQMSLLKDPRNIKQMTKEAVKPKNIFKTLSLIFVLMF